RPLLQLHSFPTRRSSDLSAERLDSLPARHVVQLARPKYAEAGEERRQDPAAQPQHNHGCGDGRDREGDSHEQVARHYTVTLPNRDRKSTRLNSSHVAISY